MMRFVRWLFHLLAVCSFWLMNPWQAHSQPGRAWADSLLRTMSTEEKVGQLFMLTAYSNQTENDYQFLQSLIERYHPGGLIFMQGSPEKQIELINRYQARSRYPMLIAQDAEWGPSMRLQGTQAYPRNMTLGAIQNDSLLYQLGRQMAYELRQLGVHMNFAPVADINNNPDNPVINDRSFGQERFNVARKALMLSRGLEDGGVIACAKHFPGHGDTGVDSHVDLPVIPHSLERLDTLELYPFYRLMDVGIGSVMVGHLHVPALDPTPNRSASLSPRIVQSLIRDRIGYQGLIVTDALNMQGVTKYFEPGEVALQALLAGNDLLLSAENIPRSVALILEALQSGKLSQETLDNHVRRVLLAKYRVGLTKWKTLSSANVRAELHRPEADVLRKQLYEQAITLAKNDRGLLPLGDLDNRRMAYVQVGGVKENGLVRNLRIYAEITEFYVSRDLPEAEREALLRQLAGFETVIVSGFGQSQRRSSSYGVTTGMSATVASLGTSGRETILVWCGNPYALRFFGQEQATVVAYEDVELAQQAAASAIFGGQRITGRLPVTASGIFPEGAGFQVRRATRLGFALPEEVGMDSRTLAGIDSLAQHYLGKKAMPGCAILVLRGNDVVYHRGFGQMEYQPGSQRIDPWATSYDLASVTKVAATTLAAMRLVEQGRLNLDHPIGRYLPEWNGFDKGQITARQLLQHTSGLPAWQPLFLKTYSDPQRKIIDRNRFRFESSEEFSLPVGPGLYARADLVDTVWSQIAAIPLLPKGRVRYSDLGMIVLGKLIERITGESLESYAYSQFFRPLGMNRTWFLPGEKGLDTHCPPTEADQEWRQCVVKGYVHDPNAALLGGIAGHAGLFSNVYDLAKLGAMLLHRGGYGERQYFLPVTIEEFTRKQQANSRKGLGWDKPSSEGSGHVSSFASEETFGHTGFTGTCLWVDPREQLVFVFLSNRTFPTASNKLLLQENVRGKIMDQAYRALAVYRSGRSGAM